MVVKKVVYSADELWEISHQSEYSNQRLELSE